MLDDSLMLASFLKGLGQTVGVHQKMLDTYLKALGQFNDHLMGQLVLSQDSIKQPLGLLESFHYFQIPTLIGTSRD